MSGVGAIASLSGNTFAGWIGAAAAAELAAILVSGAVQASLVAAGLLGLERLARSRVPALGRALVALALAKFATPLVLAWPLLPAAATLSAAVPGASAAGTPDLAGGWPMACVALWIAGSLVAVGGHVAARLDLARRLAATGPCDDRSARERLALAARRAGLRCPPELRVSAIGSTPFAAGTRHPVVVLPREWIATLAPEDLDVVLLHEAVHVRRRDALRLELAALLRALWWWNPVFHMVERRWRVQIEDRCDDEVVARLDRGAESYCRSLLRAAKLAASPRRAEALGTAGIGVHDFERRLRRVMSGAGRARRRSRVLSVAAMAVLALLVLPFLGRAPASPPGAANATAGAPSGTVTEAARESHAARHARLHAARHVHSLGLTP